MNNQMPYFNDMNQGNMNPGFNPNHMQGNFNEMMFERLNNSLCASSSLKGLSSFNSSK